MNKSYNIYFEHVSLFNLIYKKLTLKFPAADLISSYSKNLPAFSGAM